MVLEKRKIRIRTGPDGLRRGYQPSGTFTLKEAYYLHASHNTQNKQEIWERIWQENHWLKISMRCRVVGDGCS